MSLVNKSWVFLAVACLWAMGCGGSSPQTASLQENQLKDIHEMYQHFVKSQQRPPSQLSDLAKKEYEGIHPGAVKALQDGKYVLVFGVKDKDAGTVLAYEKDAASKGGAVLMADGTVKTMTADELKAAKKD